MERPGLPARVGKGVARPGPLKRASRRARVGTLVIGAVSCFNHNVSRAGVPQGTKGQVSANLGFALTASGDKHCRDNASQGVARRARAAKYRPICFCGAGEGARTRAIDNH